MDWTSLTADKTNLGSIKSLINYNKIDPAAILYEAEQRICQRLRVQGMQYITDPFTIAEDAKSTPVPEGFLGMAYKGFQISNFLPPLKRRPKNELLQNYMDTSGAYVGPPSRYAQIGTYETGGKFIFDLAADQDYSAVMTYYKRPDYLSATNTTNLLTLRYPHILRAMCTAVAAEHIRDYDESQQQLVRAGGLIDEANVASDMEDSDED